MTNETLEKANLLSLRIRKHESLINFLQVGIEDIEVCKRIERIGLSSLLDENDMQDILAYIQECVRSRKKDLQSAFDNL